MEARATAGIKALMDEALDSLPRPLTEDVTDDVFYVIETSPRLRRRYDALCDERGTTTVNTWGGFWIANAVERVGLTQVPAKKSTLIRSYSKLDRPAPPKPGTKFAEEMARRAVFDYYVANKTHLPKDMTHLREEIVALVMEGESPESAFATALKMFPKWAAPDA
jgi:hypothetical protein